MMMETIINAIMCILAYIIPLIIGLRYFNKLNEEIMGRQKLTIIKVGIFIPVINICLVLPIILAYRRYRLKYNITFHEKDFECKVYSNEYAILLKYTSDKYNVKINYSLDGFALYLFCVSMNVKEKEEYIIKKFKRLMKKQGIMVN